MREMEPSRRKQDFAFLRTVLDLDSSAISLEGLKIGDAMYVLLRDALHDNETVTSLNLAGNALTDEGIEGICSLLLRNTLVTTIDLSRNEISDWGIGAIARTLRRSDHVRSLSLSGNPFGDAGLEELCNYVKTSKTIQELCLVDTRVTFPGAVRFLEGLLENHSLRFVTMPYTLGYQYLDELKRVLQRNRLLAEPEVGIVTNCDEAALVWEEARRHQPLAEPVSSRIHNCGFTPREWSDRTTFNASLYMTLLERKSQSSSSRQSSLRSARTQYTLTTPRGTTRR